LTLTYQRYIVEMENLEIEKLLSREDSPVGSFPEVAGRAAMMAYERVSDIFKHTNFEGCSKFVLIGCGQLPITALHVMDQTNVENIVCLDVSAAAIEAVNKLQQKFGWSRLKAMACNGLEYDFSDADIVYIANMVSPKHPVLSHVTETAPKHTQIIVREPYSLGQLWAEKAEQHFGPNIQVTARGRGSRYLSRDVFIQLSPAPDG
jgi:hypothetical protein